MNLFEELPPPIVEIVDGEVYITTITEENGETFNYTCPNCLRSLTWIMSIEEWVCTYCDQEG